MFKNINVDYIYVPTTYVVVDFVELYHEPSRRKFCQNRTFGIYYAYIILNSKLDNFLEFKREFDLKICVIYNKEILKDIRANPNLPIRSVSLS